MSVAPSSTSSRRSRLVRAGVLALTTAAVLGLGLLASACGGSSSGGVAQVDSATTTTDSSSSSTDPQAAFAACMRANGAPDFPDADSQGHFDTTQVRETPDLARSHEACEHLKQAAYALDPQLAEGRRAKRQALLDYAACMRSHGVPNFPDPTFDAQGMGFPSLSQSNIDPAAPVFKAAERACSGPGTPGPKP